MLLHLLAVALVVGTIAVPLCLLRFAHPFLRNPANPAIASFTDDHLKPRGGWLGADRGPQGSYQSCDWPSLPFRRARWFTVRNLGIHPMDVALENLQI